METFLKFVRTLALVVLAVYVVYGVVELVAFLDSMGSLYDAPWLNTYERVAPNQ